MEEMHSLLRRQLRRSFGDQFSIPKEWQEFIHAVNDAYSESDMDRGMLERSLELSSHELLQANSEMRAIFQAIPDLLFRIDREGKILGYKAGANTDLGFHPTDLLGKRIQDVPLKQADEIITEAIRLVQDSKKIVNIEYSTTIQDQLAFFEARLVPHLEDQIVVIIRNITERKLAEETLFSSQQMLRTVLDTIPQRVFWKDRNLVYVGCNKPLAIDTGYSDPSELIGKTDYETSSKSIAERYRADDQQVIETGQPKLDFEEPQIRPDGSQGWLRTSKVPLRDKDGKVIGVLGTYEDVTERRVADEALRMSEQRFKTLTEAAPIGIFRTDARGLTTYVNPRWCEITQISSEKAINDGWLDVVHPDDKAWLIAGWAHSLEQKISSKAEYRYVHPDGSITWVMGEAVPQIDEHGNILGYIGTVTDITERNQVEESLKRERNLFRVVIDNLPDAIYVKDTECRKTIANIADVRNMGKKSESEVIGKTDFDFYPKSIAAKFYDDDLFVIRSGHSVLNKEEFYFDKDGKKRWLLTFKLPMRNEQGQIIGLAGIGREITEQKRAMEALTLLSHTVKSIGESISITDLENNIIFVNEAFLKTYGYTEQEIIGKPITMISCDPLIHNQMILTETMKGGWQGELLNRKKDGTVFPISLSSSVVYDEKEQLIGLVGVATDITERKRAEEALRETDERLRNIVEHSTNLFYSRNTDQVFTYLSPQARDIFDCEPDEALVHFTKFMTENSINKLGCELAEKAVRTGARQEAYELELMSSKGRRVWVEMQEAPVVKDGKTISIVGAVTDITERRWAEMALQVSEKKYRDIVTWAPIGIYQSTHSGKLLTANKGIVELLGYENMAELIGRDMGKDVYYDEKERERLITRHMKSGESITLNAETRWKKKDGSLVWVLMTIHDVRDKSSEILYYEGFVFDITERKRAEELLRVSEERYRLLVENSSDMVTEISADDKFLYVSPNVKSILGFEPMDIVGTNVLSRVYGKDKAVIGEILSKLGGSATYRYRDRQGGWHWFESSGRVYYTSSGEQRMVMVSRDITQRRKDEQQLEVSRKQLQNFTEHLEHVLEEERKRISRELHDELGQLLTILKFDLSWLKLEGSQQDVNSIAKIDAMMELVNEALASVKRISKEIRPPQLEALGLVGAIQWDLDQMEKKTGLKSIVTVEPAEVEIKSQIGAVLYRVFREALTNILRHANAEHVFIKLSQRPDSVTLTIRDDGRGITKKELKGTTSLGLVGIRERLRMVGGTFTVEGEKGKGTVMSIDVPLKKKGNGERIS